MAALADFVHACRGRVLEWVKRPARALEGGYIARGTLPPTPRQVFAHIDDAAWLATLVASIKQPLQKGVILPGFPDEALQTHTVGSANENALREGSKFYAFARQACAANGRSIGPRTTILDFGVSWGRIVRFFLKETDADCLHGVDVNERYLEAARETGCQARLQKIEPLGQLPYVDGLFDLVYAYSVFTHLPERVQDHWLAEIRRVLKPGGIFVATVEPPRFLDFFLDKDPSDPRLHPWHSENAKKAHADPTLKARLAERGYIYLPSHAGGSEETEVYGDCVMTPEYVSRHWGRLFELLQFLDDAQRFWQAVVTLRRHPLPPAA